jgi:hypothetical protein
MRGLQLQQLFPDQQEWDSIQTLMAAANLLRGGSSSAGAVQQTAAESAAWAELYSSQHAAAVLLVLACWMPEPLAAGFIRSHQVMTNGGRTYKRVVLSAGSN